MKRLFIIRHARADRGSHQKSDPERPLSSEGERDAQLLGAVLRDQYHAHVDRMLCSPARRALQTAQILAQAIGFDEQKIEFREQIYDGSIEALIQLLLYTDDSIRVLMLIGHNPNLTFLANHLCLGSIETIPPGGGIILDFDIDSWTQLLEKKSKPHVIVNPPRP